MEKFEHNFKEPTSLEEAQEIFGYTRGMRNVVSFLKEKFNINPDNKYVDGTELLSIITATNEELHGLLHAYSNKLRAAIDKSNNSKDSTPQH